MTLLALVLASSLAQANLTPQPTDDDLHFLVGAGAGAGSYALMSVVTQDRWARVLFSAGMPMAAGFGREYTQSNALRNWNADNTSDMVWTGVGAAFSALFSYAIDRYINPPDPNEKCFYADGPNGRYRVCLNKEKKTDGD